MRIASVFTYTGDAYYINRNMSRDSECGRLRERRRWEKCVGHLDKNKRYAYEVLTGNPNVRCCFELGI